MTVTTIDGPVTFTLTFTHCPEHGPANAVLKNVMDRIRPSRRTIDSKVMIAVGLLRWRFNYQRKEVRTILSARGISISEGSVSNLSREFLLRFYALHRRRIPAMKTHFEDKGGVRLHLDGTGEAGDNIVFTAKEGATAVTLDARCMPSETKKYITPFLRALRADFGAPIVVVRDMRDEIRDSVTSVFPNTKQQICHYHYVANLGKRLFKDSYSSFRKSIVGKRILSKIKTMRNTLTTRTIPGSGMQAPAVVAEQAWAALACEYLLRPREEPSKYPFTLPYSVIMDRVQEVKRMLSRVLRWNTRHRLDVKAVRVLDRHVTRLARDRKVRALHKAITKVYCWFEKVRSTLRVSRDLSRNGTSHEPTDARKVMERLNETLTEILRDAREAGGDFPRVAQRIDRNVRNHWDELAVDVIDAAGKRVKIVRTNELEERSHRWSRMKIRRQTGRSRTTNEMSLYGALLAVFSNMENETYRQNVLHDVVDFVREMQSVTNREILKAERLVVQQMKKPLLRNDTERSAVLNEFIHNLQNCDDPYDKKFELWLKKLNLPNAQMTP